MVLAVENCHCWEVRDVHLPEELCCSALLHRQSPDCNLGVVPPPQVQDDLLPDEGGLWLYDDEGGLGVVRPDVRVSEVGGGVGDEGGQVGPEVTYVGVVLHHLLDHLLHKVDGVDEETLATVVLDIRWN